MPMIATALSFALLAPLAGAHAASTESASAAGASVGRDARALVTDAARPLEPRELADLRSGVPAASIVLDLPRLGCVTVDLVATGLVTDGFALEIARIDGGRTIARRATPQLPLAYSGTIAGMPDASAFIGIGTGAAEGLVAGFVKIGGETWWLSSGSEPSRRAGLPAMVAHESAFESHAMDGARCGAMDLKQPFDLPVPQGGAGDGGVAGGVGCREYRVAIDTDTEYTMGAHGGNVVAASQYALLLMGAASQVYDRDINVKLPVSYLRLWTGEDPWTQTEMGAQLGQYRDHWMANMGAVPRDVGHHLAGRGLGGGVAWLGVACLYPEWAFALSSGIGYGFPYPLVDHDHGNWEPMVVTHELGHNFGAPHTHDHTPQADGCGTNDCSQAGQGTIMSYCHICAGGMSNIALKFHPYSINSMNGHIAATACGNAGSYAVDDAVSTLEGTAASIAPLANDAFVHCGALALTAFDPGSVNGGTVVIAPTQPGEPPVLLYTPAPGFDGIDSFAYTVQEAGGATSSARVYITVRPVLDRIYLDGAGPGAPALWYALAGDTGALPDFAALTPYGSALLPNIDIASTGDNFSSSGRADLVAAVFEGFIEVPATGLWTLSTESDDGSRLLIDGVPVANNDGLHGMVERSGQIALEAGVHRYRVEFFENFGGAGLIVRWQGPGTGRAVIPPSAFIKGGTVMQLDLDGNGSVGAADLAALLAAWGPATAGQPADFDRNGAVDAGDLARILANWGA